jgi:DNA polymerase III alpha subunit
MRLDKYSNPIFTEKDIFEAIYQGFEFSVKDTFLVEQRSNDIQKLEKEIGFKFLEPYETHFDTTDYDKACQQIWNMPDEYKNMDIIGFLVNECPKQNYQRLMDELDAYKAKNMLDLLRWLKYFVDTCRKNNVVWGVGRGSSVASYVLYLIGVHKIDSVKYNLEWQEFLR